MSVFKVLATFALVAILALVIAWAMGAQGTKATVSLGADASAAPVPGPGLAGARTPAAAGSRIAITDSVRDSGVQTPSLASSVVVRASQRSTGVPLAKGEVVAACGDQVISIAVEGGEWISPRALSGSAPWLLTEVWAEGRQLCFLPVSLEGAPPFRLDAFRPPGFFVVATADDGALDVDVTVRRYKFSGAYFFDPKCTHPGNLGLMRVPVFQEPSPLFLPTLRKHSPPYWVGAPSKSWQRIPASDTSSNSVARVDLQPGGTIDVTLDAFREVDGAYLAVISKGAHRDDVVTKYQQLTEPHFEMSGLVPGEYELLLTTEEFPRKETSMAQSGTLLVAAGQVVLAKLQMPRELSLVETGRLTGSVTIGSPAALVGA